MARLVLPSSAKINWVLRVVGLRQDGYHEVLTVLQTIDLADEIHLEGLPGRNIELTVEGRDVLGGPKNLIWQAAQLLCDSCGIRAGARVHLRKRIPVGAGLGGGSSNAAVTLMGLNLLWECGLDHDRLLLLASRLGSDVPFFLVGGTALGEGRGERIQALPDWPDPKAMILLFPGVEIPTSEAYRLGGWTGRSLLTKNGIRNKIMRFREAERWAAGVWSLVQNDFEAPIFNRYPILVQARDRLRAAGCRNVFLCGSGSTLAGLSPAGSEFEAARAVSQEGIGEVFLCHVLSRIQYRENLARQGVAIG